MKGNDELTYGNYTFQMVIDGEEERLLKWSIMQVFLCWGLLAKRRQGNKRQQGGTIDSQPENEKGVVKGKGTMKSRCSLVTRGRKVTRVGGGNERQ